MEISALGSAPNNRIHPSYGVFSPVRGEYIQLVLEAPLPSSELAFDIGVGTGVLSAVLAKRGVKRVVGTDLDPRAMACAKENIQRLGLNSKVELTQTDLFPEGKAPLIVCNPPWLPARASAPIERAIYDENSGMLKGFLAGLAAHLAPMAHSRRTGRMDCSRWLEGHQQNRHQSRAQKSSRRNRPLACGKGCRVNFFVALKRSLI
jgi:methylase of polypeptide subunit release factors